MNQPTSQAAQSALDQPTPTNATTLPQREDLLRLSPEALAHACNMGLVKRAQKELASAPPRLVGGEQNSIEAHFTDGTHTVWPQHAAIKDTRCSCAAAGVCRHRIILALAYLNQSSLVPATLANPALAPDALAAWFAPAILKIADDLARAGLRITLHAQDANEPCPTARLPAATVRFWGGDQLAAAKCDCIRSTLCEHVYLGAKAFYLAQQEHPFATAIQLGGTEAAHAIDTLAFDALISHLWQHGVEAGALRHAGHLSAAKIQALAAKATWLISVLAELEWWIEAYEARSAKFDVAHGIQLVTELSLRLQIGQRAGFAKSALGIGVVQEVVLDQVRLLCLGSRLTQRDQVLEAQLVLADVDTGTQFVLQHHWSRNSSMSLSDELLAQRLAPGLKLIGLSDAQLLAKGAKRSADGTLKLARARTEQNALLPQRGDWQKLPPTLRYSSVQALRASHVHRPRAALAPRHAQPNFCVLAVTAIQEVYYDAAQQRLAAVLVDSDGERFIVQRDHEAHAPQALDAFAAALHGQYGPISHIAGTAQFEAGQLTIDPYAVCANRVVSFDCEASTGQLKGVALMELDTAAADPLANAVRHTQSLLADYLFRGLNNLSPASQDRIRAHVKQLQRMELHQLASCLQDVLSNRDPKQLQRCAIRCALTLEEISVDGLTETQ